MIRINLFKRIIMKKNIMNYLNGKHFNILKEILQHMFRRQWKNLKLSRNKSYIDYLLFFYKYIDFYFTLLFLHLLLYLIINNLNLYLVLLYISKISLLLKQHHLLDYPLQIQILMVQMN